MKFNDQSEYAVRCEWGLQGIQCLAPISDVIIIVDVLSFSTSVEIATAGGAIVFPYRWNDDSAAEFANASGALLAGQRGSSGYSLSPVSLMKIESGTKLVLPSPNGAELTLQAGNAVTLAGSLRNCRTIAEAINSRSGTVSLIPAGERWADGGLRPAIEDLIGVGAIISYLNGSRSPEAETALAAFEGARPVLADMLMACSSGKELIDRGFRGDVEIAAQLDVSETVPEFKNEAYTNQSISLRSAS
jgi:2-phosphosulfolactate phosphatase